MGIRDGRASLIELLLGLEIGCRNNLDRFFGGGSADRRPLLLEDWRVHLLVHFLAIDKPLHVVSDNGHLEDFRGRWTLQLVLSHQLQDQGLQLRTVVRRDRIRVILHDLEHEAEQIVAQEWLLEGAELVEDDSQRPDITLRCVRSALTRLWRHVVGCAHHGHGLLRGGV